MKNFNIIWVFLFGIMGNSICAQEQNFKKIAEATINPMDTKIAIGEDYNIVALEEYGDIRLLHKNLEKMDIKKKEDAFIASFFLTNKEIVIQDVKLNEQQLSFNFLFKNMDAPDYTFSGFIDFINTNPPSIRRFSEQKEVLIKYILPVVHDYLTIQAIDVKNSCLNNALKACDGKVEEIDVNILFSGCYFSCY